MDYLKGESAPMAFDRHANVKHEFGNRRFWAEGALRVDGRAERGDDLEVHSRA